MSNLINQENQKISSLKGHLILTPSQSLTLTQKESQIKENLFLTDKKISEKKTNFINMENLDNIDPNERLKIIDELINKKKETLVNINNKLNIISKIEKSNSEPLNYLRKQEILEDNKIKEKYNSKNISLGKKLVLISEKVKKLESELLYGKVSNSIPLKEKLKEIKNKREIILSRMRANDNEIKKIDDKEKKYTFKEKKLNFLENLEKIQENNNSKKIILKKNLLTDNNININDMFNKCLYEEKIQNRIKDEKIKEIKYKELREKELAKVKHRKLIQLENERYLKTNNWIEGFINNKNYLSWEEKEKERLKKEELLITLENNKRKIKYSPISSEELNQFSNFIKNEQLKVKNELKTKKLQLEEIWKERKGLIPEHKSKFELLNIKMDNEAKEEKLLKKEEIKENILIKNKYANDVSKKYNKPKLINDKLKKQRLDKIMELKGINKQNEIKALSNKLKLKSLKLVKSQPKIFKMNNNVKTMEDNNEQKDKNNEKESGEKNNILDNDIRLWKKILNNNGDIFNIEENKILDNNEGKKYIIKRNKSNTVNKSSGSYDIKSNNINIYKWKEEKQNKKHINEIKEKLNILDKLIKE